MGIFQVWTRNLRSNETDTGVCEILGGGGGDEANITDITHFGNGTAAYKLHKIVTADKAI